MLRPDPSRRPAGVPRPGRPRRNPSTNGLEGTPPGATRPSTAQHVTPKHPRTPPPPVPSFPQALRVWGRVASLRGGLSTSRPWSSRFQSSWPCSASERGNCPLLREAPRLDFCTARSCSPENRPGDAIGGAPHDTPTPVASAARQELVGRPGGPQEGRLAAHKAGGPNVNTRPRPKAALPVPVQKASW